MSKTAYYTHALKNGGYFDAIIVPDDFEATYPITMTAIPEDLQVSGSVPKYNWATATWEDTSADAEEAAKLESQKKLDDATNTAKAAKATADTAAGAVTELMDYVSTLSTTNTEETANA